MTRHGVKIHGGPGLGHVVELDGQPVQHHIQSLRLDISHSSLPVLELRLLLPPGTEDVSTAAAVVVDEETAAVLQRLGWTPPESED